jgi:type II secretory pathway component PulJ
LAPPSRPLRRAFSLIEVLVVVGLLSGIILGLVLMFTQTQRAYRLGTTQVDVLEGGRSVTDLLTRDLLQISPAYQNNFNGAANFYAIMHNEYPLVQTLPGNAVTAPNRTNVLADFFFLSKENQTWSGIGYRVLDPATGDWPRGGVGALYRYSSNAFYGQNLTEIYDAYFNQTRGNPTALTNMSRVLDGVVHFKIRTFDAEGFWINRNIGTSAINIFTNANGISAPVVGYPFGETPQIYFLSNAVPASLEIELGILEERVAERARSINNPTARSNYLAKEVGKVHIFRWRVPIRNVDPIAYQ